jgi:hypothetical protein
MVDTSVSVTVVTESIMMESHAQVRVLPNSFVKVKKSLILSMKSRSVGQIFFFFFDI